MMRVLRQNWASAFPEIVSFSDQVMAFMIEIAKELTEKAMAGDAQVAQIASPPMH